MIDVMDAYTIAVWQQGEVVAFIPMSWFESPCMHDSGRFGASLWQVSPVAEGLASVSRLARQLAGASVSVYVDVMLCVFGT